MLEETLRRGLDAMGLPCDAEALRFTGKNVAALAVLFLLGLGMAAGYGVYSYNTTSLSASYTAQERFDQNERARALVTERNPDITDAQDMVVIVESA